MTAMSRTRQKTLARIVLLGVALFGLFILYRVQQIDVLTKTTPIFPEEVVDFKTQFPPKEKLGSLALTEKQCAETFPLLTKEINDAEARGPFQLSKVDVDMVGVVQGKIKDGKVLSLCLNILL